MTMWLKSVLNRKCLLLAFSSFADMEKACACGSCRGTMSPARPHAAPSPRHLQPFSLVGSWRPNSSPTCVCPRGLPVVLLPVVLCDGRHWTSMQRAVKDGAVASRACGRAEAGGLACSIEVKVFCLSHWCYKHTGASRIFLCRKKCINQS